MTYHENDNDGRFPDDNRVEVRYPRARAAWPWLPGSIVKQCGPDQWRVCVEDRGVAVLRDGRPAPRNSASRNLHYPMCFQQVRDPGAFFAVLGEVIAQRIDELAGYLAGDDPPGEGYLAKVARLTAARDHAKGRVLGEYLLLPPDEDRPVVVDRGHPSWAEVDAEQRERLGDRLSEEGRP